MPKATDDCWQVRSDCTSANCLGIPVRKWRVAAGGIRDNRRMSAASALFTPACRLRTPEPVLDTDLCWRMVRSRDPRFDGLFFFGVKTTGVYCRPVCPARTPLAGNCVFFGHAAQAEQHGFRPCLRCRPELAPGQGSTEMPATGVQHWVRTAIAALDQVRPAEDGARPSPIQRVAHQLGISDRHLRRVFVQTLGVSAQAYLQTQRLLMAKRLLTDTRLPVIEVAAIAGFGSLRRFNASWRQQYGLTPSQLRRNAAEPHPKTCDSHEVVSGFTFSLPTRPPFDLDALMAFFLRRQVDGLESVRDRCLRRALVMSNAEGVAQSGWVEIEAMAPTRGTGLTVRMSPSLASVIPAVLSRVRRAFDLSCRPEAVAQVLGTLAAGHEGLRIPGAFDGFEIAVRAIVGQQITVAQATRRLTDLVTTFGDPIDSPWPEVNRSFPSAATLAGQPLEAISQVLQHRARARAIHRLAQAVTSGQLVLEPTADIDTALAALKAIPGVGEWTAQYVALRALGWPDAFPGSDAGLLKALGTRNPRQANQIAQRWRPFRAYAALHLWHRGPEAEGLGALIQTAPLQASAAPTCHHPDRP